MSAQPESTIDTPAALAATNMQPDRPPRRASTPEADRDAPVVISVPPSVSAPQASGRTTPPAQRGAVHVAPNLQTLMTALPQGDAGEVQERRDLNAVVHGVLMIGLAISSALMLVGIGLDLVYQPELPTAVPSISDVLGRVVALRPSGFLALGLLVLIATPIVRVAGSIGAFLYERDWRYAAITSLVLLVLIVSLILGRG